MEKRAESKGIGKALLLHFKFQKPILNSFYIFILINVILFKIIMINYLYLSNNLNSWVTIN
jgi:hypothetical protein